MRPFTKMWSRMLLRRSQFQATHHARIAKTRIDTGIDPRKGLCSQAKNSDEKVPIVRTDHRPAFRHSRLSNDRATRMGSPRKRTSSTTGASKTASSTMEAAFCKNSDWFERAAPINSRRSRRKGRGSGWNRPGKKANMRSAMVKSASARTKTYHTCFHSVRSRNAKR